MRPAKRGAENKQMYAKAYTKKFKMYMDWRVELTTLTCIYPMLSHLMSLRPQDFVRTINLGTYLKALAFCPDT